MMKINANDLSIPLCMFYPEKRAIIGNSSFMEIAAAINDEEFTYYISRNIQNMHDKKHTLIDICGQQYVLSLIGMCEKEDALIISIEREDEFNDIVRDFDQVKKIEKQYLSILESLHDDFCIVDESGKLETILPNFEHFYGMPASKAIGKTVFEMEEKKIFNPSIVARAIRTGKTESMLQMTGNNKYLICTAIPIKDAQGNLMKVVSFSRDVTQYENLKAEYASLEKAIESYSKQIEELKKAKKGIPTLIGESSAIKKTLTMIDHISNFDVNIFLSGESGVGKTVYAKAIHQKSSRANNPFVELNCGAIPETLFESELFGYEKGAFTGANEKGKMGWIERANGGTLFLDEIADLPLPMQVKLLKTLDNKTIMRVGDTKEISVNFRLIAATNKDLSSLVAEGKFREDLFFRLNVMPIHIPPLRERKDDIFPLINYFLKKNEKKYSIERTISSKAIEYMLAYSWPGNIRELENLIERLVLTTENYMITEEDLPDQIIPASKVPSFDLAEQTLPELLAAIEKKMIMDSYNKSHCMTTVAKELGISQPKVSKKMKQYLSEE